MKIKIFYKGTPEQIEQEFNKWMEDEPSREIVSISTAASVTVGVKGQRLDSPIPQVAQVNVFTLTVLYRELGGVD